MKKRKIDILFLSFFLLSIATFIAGLALNRTGYREIGLGMMSISVALDVFLLVRVLMTIWYKEGV